LRTPTGDSSFAADLRGLILNFIPIRGVFSEEALSQIVIQIKISNAVHRRAKS
jgi:hypothetical protein